MEELPPTTSPDAVISWFRIRYNLPDVEDRVKYLNDIMRRNRLHIDGIGIGKQIKDWTVTTRVGTVSYHPDFKPPFTPDIMIRLGIFGGLGIKGIENEIPIEWIIFGILGGKISSPNDVFPTQQRNYYNIIADPWPTEDETRDSRNFFHWFCRYYLGRRSPEEDAIMIGAWKEKTKFLTSVVNDRSHNRLIHRQHLLQWGIRT